MNQIAASSSSLPSEVVVPSDKTKDIATSPVNLLANDETGSNSPPVDTVFSIGRSGDPDGDIIKQEQYAYKMSHSNETQNEDKFSPGYQHMESQLPKITRIVKKSDEEGFQGSESDKWFDEKELRQNLIASMHSSDPTDLYFDSYSHYYIHEEMIKDKIRTKSYQMAIMSNAECLKDKIVLDIGCGTGILSIFAARAGAKHVYAIDNAEIAEYAKYIIKQNGFSD